MDMVEMHNHREVVLRNNTDTKLNKKFTFDRAFGPESKQVSPLLLLFGPLQRPFEMNNIDLP